jgi:DNA-binding MarR family transcriptional regulator
MTTGPGHQARPEPSKGATMLLPEHQRVAQGRSAKARAAATREAVLATLRVRGGRGASNRYVVAATGRTKSTVNRTLTVLVAEGMVDRYPDQFDARIPKYRLKEAYR